MILAVRESRTLDAAGQAAVLVGPVPPWQTWTVQRVALRMVFVSAIPECRLYRGQSADPGGYIDGSVAANDDVSEHMGIVLRTGEAMYAHWVNGTPGQVVNLALEGDIERTGQAAR